MRRFRPVRARVPVAILAAGALVLLAGCVGGPRLVAGLPDETGWLVLPVDDWSALDRGEPEGVAACLDADCPDRLMVSVLRLRGEAAQEARAVLADPRRLATYLAERDRADTNDARRAVTTQVETRRLAIEGLDGFAVSLAAAATGRSAHGATLAREEGDELRIALVVGDDAAAVEAALRQVAAEAF
ncbi:hypothetical protein [Salinarimonas rosea]|uniref:hypothetical protein n=1 Tax=Salinarimonas rosea TaxID=552063 RepID=UPI0012EB7BCA|nr:hypothetical protein [Salinarimonas rosea]